MREFLRKLISSDNDINEPVVIGIILIIPFMVSYFLPEFPQSKFDSMGLLVGACFGIATVRAIGVNKKEP